MSAEEELYYATGWTTDVQFPAEEGTFSLRHRVQTDFRHPPSLLSKGYWGLLPLG